MKSFIQKKEELTQLKDKLSRSKITIFTTFSRAGEKGLSVSEMKALKKSLRAGEGEYMVSKKTLINKAITERPGVAPDKAQIDIYQYPGSVGLVFGYGDEAGIAKSLYTFARKNPAMKLFGALYGQRFLDGDTLTVLAKLPTREVMLARLLGMMKYPMVGLANVLQGNIRNLVVVLNQISKQK